MKKTGLQITSEEISKQNKMIKEKEIIIMTEKNIEIMGRIVDEMVGGKKLSKALETVYKKRKISIPFSERTFDDKVEVLGLSNRSYNVLMRSKLYTINDVIKYRYTNSFMNLRFCGVNSAIEIIESIVDYAWKHLNNEEKAQFLIETVKANEGNLR